MKNLLLRSETEMMEIIEYLFIVIRNVEIRELKFPFSFITSHRKLPLRIDQTHHRETPSRSRKRVLFANQKLHRDKSVSKGVPSSRLTRCHVHREPVTGVVARSEQTAASRARPPRTVLIFRKSASNAPAILCSTSC